MHQTWFIASRRKSIWILWAYIKYIKDRSFWNLETLSNYSWGWKGILSKHSQVLQHLTHIISVGKLTKVWHDPWLPCGRIKDRYEDRLSCNLGLGDQITINSFINEGFWSTLNPTWGQLMEILHLIQSKESPAADYSDKSYGPLLKMGISCSAQLWKSSTSTSSCHLNAIPFGFLVWFLSVQLVRGWL